MSILLATLEGERGVFTISQDGGHPNLGIAFIYQDESYRFWFYVSHDSQTSLHPAIEILSASQERFSRKITDFRKFDLEYLQNNIRIFFNRFGASGNLLSDHEARSAVNFTWRM